MKNFIMLTALDGRKVDVAVSLIKYWVADGCVTRVYFEDYYPEATNFGCFKESVEEIAEKIEKATEAISENSMGEFAEATSNKAVKKDKKVSKNSQLDNDAFVLIDAEGLSMKDAFMQYQPETEKEKVFKKLLTEVIRKGVKNFYCSKYDPSSNYEEEEIDFVPGIMPVVSKSYQWWEKASKEFAPERNSRLGTRSEYVAFLGVLIKMLTTEGKSLAWAWKAVCNDSKELGHYCDSKNAKHIYELTGSRKICVFFDLANTSKILAEDKDNGGFWNAGGNYKYNGDCCPLSNLIHFVGHNLIIYGSVGWIVLS